LTVKESALLLFHRSNVLPLGQSLEDTSPEMLEVACEVGRALDGLPLALDQAGAYVEESGCSIANYLDRYQTARALLLQRRGNTQGLHPSSVTTTFTLSFARLTQCDAQAAHMLRLCAFLSPDAIPEEFLIHAGEPVEEEISLPRQVLHPTTIDAAITTLRRSSLLCRHPDTQTVSVHRLVQSVLKDQMDEQEQRRWAERAVRIVGAAFPSVERLTTWALCQRYLPHAYACLELIERWHLASPEAIYLLRQTSAYLRERTQQAQADILEARAGVPGLQGLEPSSQEMLTDFFSFMRYGYYQGNYHQRKTEIHEKMALLERTLGSEHPDRIYLWIGQAIFCQMEGKYRLAEELYQRVLAIQNVGLLHQWLVLPDGREATGLPHVAFVLSWLGQLYTAQGKYEQAEQIFEQSQAIWDQFADLTHIFRGACLHGFALLLLLQCRCEKAQSLLEQERTMLVQSLGQEHPLLANNSNLWAHLALVQGDLAMAQMRLEQAKDLLEQTTGLEHPFASRTFHLWAQLCLEQGQMEQAETFCLRAMYISETTQGSGHPEAAVCMRTLADIFCIQSRWGEAELFYQRVLAVDKETLGTTHPHYTATLECYTRLLQHIR
jgi:tetratricopeptide (TPR) repeat protein